MKIYNSKTQKKEMLKTINDKKIKMYVCGPTLYDEIHIGNARPIIFFDVVFRFFTFLNYKVEYISNITDIDDKIIDRALQMNLSEKELVDINFQKFEKILKKLNILEITKRPKVTNYINEIIDFIDKLLEKDYAYKTSSGDIAFRIDKVSSYGEVSGEKIDNLISGTRVKKDQTKENELDFILWKNTQKGISWEAPFGKGRPGWHTECVVMINKVLGKQVDIHGGGIDLKFPHHENENAQNLAINKQELANYWLHNGFVNINNEKMSKSLNNFITLKDFLEKYGVNTTRLLVLQTNYRQPINLTEEFIEETKKINLKIQKRIKNIENIDKKIKNIFIKLDENKIKDIIEIVNDDFNTSNLISLLLQEIKTPNDERIILMLQLLGLTVEKKQEDIPEEIIELANNRSIAKHNKEFVKADNLRNEVLKKGYKIVDTRDGYEIEKISQ